jgi:hypothetical protein
VAAHFQLNFQLSDSRTELTWFKVKVTLRLTVGRSVSFGIDPLFDNHHPSACFYLKTPSCLYFKIQLFGDRFCLRLLVKPTKLGPIDIVPTFGSIRWAQLSRCHLKTETESSLRNVLFLDKDRTMDIVHQHNICTYLPLSQTLGSYLHNAELQNLYCSPNTIRITKPRRIRREGHIVHTGKKTNLCMWENNGTMDLIETG